MFNAFRACLLTPPILLTGLTSAIRTELVGLRRALLNAAGLVQLLAGALLTRALLTEALLTGAALLLVPLAGAGPAELLACTLLAGALLLAENALLLLVPLAGAGLSDLLAGSLLPELLVRSTLVEMTGTSLDPGARIGVPHLLTATLLAEPAALLSGLVKVSLHATSGALIPVCLLSVSRRRSRHHQCRAQCKKCPIRFQHRSLRFLVYPPD